MVDWVEVLNNPAVREAGSQTLLIKLGWKIQNVIYSSVHCNHCYLKSRADIVSRLAPWNDRKSELSWCRGLSFNECLTELETLIRASKCLNTCDDHIPINLFACRVNIQTYIHHLTPLLWEPHVVSHWDRPLVNHITFILQLLALNLLEERLRVMAVASASP